MEELGKRIRQYRLQRCWTQEEFASRVGISVSYVGMLERGEKQPKLEMFIQIANVLGVSADELLADSLNVGYKVTVSKYTEQIGKRSLSDQKKIYALIDAILQNI